MSAIAKTVNSVCQTVQCFELLDQFIVVMLYNSSENAL